MIVIDLGPLLSTLIPLAVSFGASIFAITLIHMLLSAVGNRFATEVSALSGLAIFSTIEVLRGSFSVVSILAMLCIVTTMVLLEVYRPTIAGNEQTFPQLLNPESENDVLCFSFGSGYSTLAAVSVVGIPSKPRYEEGEENADLKWLYPLWEDGKKSHLVYTLEAVLNDGLVDLRFFISSQHKDWEKSIEQARRGRQLIESWLSKKHYEFRPIQGDDLRALYFDIHPFYPRIPEDPYIARTQDSYLGMFTVDGYPISLSSNLGTLLQQFSEMKLSGRVLLSFNSGSIPKIRDEVSAVRVDSQQQPRVSSRAEEHRHRKMHKQMAEIEASEETGSFRVGIAVMISGSSVKDAMNGVNNASASSQGILGGTKVTKLLVKNMLRVWRKVLLKQIPLGTTTISGARLTALLHLSSGMPGTPSRIVSPDFGLPISAGPSTKTIALGSVLYKDKETSQDYRMPIDSLCYHVLIAGNPGSGKTNTAELLVHEVHQSGIPFLVIVPAKKDWRILCDHIPKTRVFTAQDLRYNFMDVPLGVPVATHISNITTCFIAAWPTEGILKEHISKVFRRAYRRAGWDLVNNTQGSSILLVDLYEAMEEVANELRYGGKLKQDFIGALTARFETLIDDPLLSVIFNTDQGLSIEDLLSHPTIVELNNLNDSNKALVTSLITLAVTEYLEANSTYSNPGIGHLLVLEEAHHVLKQVGGFEGYDGHSAQQHAIDTIVQLLREARGLGLGIILIDQLPGHLAVAAVKLPGITIIHSLFDARERALVGAHANLSDEQLLHIGVMRCGEAIIHQAFAGEAVKVKVKHFDSAPTQHPWTDERLERLMEPFYSENPWLRLRNVPVIDTWKPDERVLTELKYIVASPQFKSTYDSRREAGAEIAVAYVRGLVARFISDPRDVDAYTKLLLSHIEGELEAGFDEEETSID